MSSAVGTPAPGAAQPMVKAEGVHKSFGHVEVLKGIDLQVAPREVMCIVGPSGSGKSLLLRALAERTGAPLHLLIESARGLRRVFELAECHPLVAGVAPGETDLAADRAVASFFDGDRLRSIPTRRRPRAAVLMHLLRRFERGREVARLAAVPQWSPHGG